MVETITHGTDGKITKKTGEEILNLSYVVVDYVQGGHLFYLSKTVEAFGEDEAKYFFVQLLDLLKYLHHNGNRNVNFKLENILVDIDMKLKLTDLTFSDANEEI